jgi:hypothetical protein
MPAPGLAPGQLGRVFENLVENVPSPLSEALSD